MVVKFRNSIAILMVGLLLLPSIVKLEHHHDHFVCHAKNEKHFQEHHEKCQICNFEFSVFSVSKIEFFHTTDELIGIYIAPCYKFFYSDWSKYSFLLRAPPLNIHN